MYVAQYENNASRRNELPAVPRRSVSSVNTHDMANFAAYWESHDLEILFSLGLFDEQEIEAEFAGRQTRLKAMVQFLRGQGFLPEDHSPTCLEALEGLLAFLAQSNSELMLVNLEDLWLGAEPQNTPGTGYERPSWRRKTSYSLEEITRSPELGERLQRLSQVRNPGSGTQS